MGKRIIQQARGKGGPRYRSPGHRFVIRVKYANLTQENTKGIVTELIHCPGHSAPLAKIRYENGIIGYIFAPEGICVGQEICHGRDSSVKTGNILPLGQIPEGTFIYNIENAPGDGGKLVRASGTSARVVARQEDGVMVRMPSKKQKLFNSNCFATIGIICGLGKKEKPIIKAGNAFYAKKARNKLYPMTSAGAMNATDHPFGSGRKGPKFGGRDSSIAPRNAPPGRKVGLLRPRKTGRGK